MNTTNYYKKYDKPIKVRYIGESTIDFLGCAYPVMDLQKGKIYVAIGESSYPYNCFDVIDESMEAYGYPKRLFEIVE